MKNQEATRTQLMNQDGQDTGLFDDDVSCSLVKHHLIKNVHDLTHKLIIFLLGCKTQNTKGQLQFHRIQQLADSTAR